MKFFKQSIPAQAAVILLAMAALWGSAIVAPQAMPVPQGSDVLYGVLYGWLAGTPRLATIIGMLLVLAGGVLLNMLLVDIDLSSQNSLLPTLLYVICMSAGNTTLTPMVLVSLLLVACMNQLALRGSLLTIPPERACATTALMGLCSMFYLPATLMILSYMLVAINYRLYTWRDWAVMILGFVAPYILMATVLMFTDGLETWWQGVAEASASVHLSAAKAPVLQTIGCIVLALALVAGLVAVSRRSGESKVVWQKNAITLLCTMPGGLAMLAVSRLFPIDMQFFALPFTFGVYCLLMPQSQSSGYGRRKSRDWVYTLILIALFVATMIC